MSAGSRSNPFDITGKLAFVTGSSRGLGNALARGLAEAGANVVLHSRGGERLEAARREIADATGADVATLVADHGVPDILVNNAGIQRRAPFNEFDPKDWGDMVATNLSSAFYVSQQVSRGMAARGSGKIINIGSVQSMLARQTIAPYSASKGGVAMLTKGMAVDLARYNIQVNTISPGYFATEMNRALQEDEAFNTWVINRTPAQRWGQFAELVGTLVYLSSGASGFVSGQNIFVDGGMTSVV